MTNKIVLSEGSKSRRIVEFYPDTVSTRISMTFFKEDKCNKCEDGWHNKEQLLALQYNEIFELIKLFKGLGYEFES